MRSICLRLRRGDDLLLSIRRLTSLLLRVAKNLTEEGDVC